MAERARNGVDVHLVVDAIGSFRTSDSYFDELRRAGGKMFWYQPLRPKNLLNIDRRTHRKLMVVDGKLGFIGVQVLQTIGSAIANKAIRGVTQCFALKGVLYPVWFPFSRKIGSNALEKS